MLNSLRTIDCHGRRILAVPALFFIITGLDTGKKIMGPQLAKQLYENVLPPIVYILLVIYGTFPIRTEFLRRKVVKNEQVPPACAYVIAMAILVLCFWLHSR